jgi:hypothetical protein
MVGAEVKLIFQFVVRGICQFWTDEVNDFRGLFGRKPAANAKRVRPRQIGSGEIYRHGF